MNPPSPNHIIDDDLEAYSLQKPLLGTKLAEIEDHIMACDLCRSRLDDIDAYAVTMKATRRLLDARDRERNSQE